MTKQLTRLGTGYSIPSPNLGQFPVTPIKQIIQITTLASYSMPGPKYRFPAAPVPFNLFIGSVSLQAFWQAQLSGVVVPPSRTQITALKSSSLPGAPYFFPIKFENGILFVGVVDLQPTWTGQLGGINSISRSGQITALSASSLPGPAYRFPDRFFNSITLIGKVAQQLSWSAPIVGTIPFNSGSVNMAKQFCQQYDIGVKLIYQFIDQTGAPINLVGATSLVLKLGYPDSTPQVPHSVDKTATFLSDGSDGKIYYTTISNDLSQNGLYEVQGKFTVSGKTYSGQQVDLQVLPNVDNN